METDTSSLLSFVTVIGPTILAVVALFSLIWLFNRAIRRRHSGLQKVQQNYMQALVALKQAPGDGALRQEAMRWGREYAQRLQNSGREMDFDETALDIDLLLVTSGEARAADESSQRANRARRRRLRELQREGVFSDGE